MKPLIIINFKAYPEVLGNKEVRLAKICEKVARKNKNFEIVIAPQTSSLSLIAKEIKIPVFAQALDAVEPGAFTGHVTAAAIKESGCQGTLINHAEMQVTLEKIKKNILLCKKYKLTSVVCAANLNEVKDIVSLEPDYIAYEPPELIGGDISVTHAKPSVVKNSVDLVAKHNSKVKVLCGAGVKTNKDLKKALELGTAGVLLASGIVKAKNPEKALRDLINI